MVSKEPLMVSLSNHAGHSFPIALKPADPRDQCRLLVLDRQSGAIGHRRFGEILEFFHGGDCLVLNISKVFPARLRFWVNGKLGDMLLGALPGPAGEALVKMERRSLRRLESSGGQVRFKDSSTGRIEVLGFDEDAGAFKVRLSAVSLLEQLGETPLPPYITRARKEAGLPLLEDRDSQVYQCVYAQVPGSAACPTAGLHWTQELLQAARDKGVAIARIVLHVGFASIIHGEGRTRLPAEEFMVEQEEARLINNARQSGHRVIACGTSVVRTLESACDADGRIHPQKKATDLFIKTGYSFRAVDAMITNFHLPQSTNFLMTQAFLGKGRSLDSVYQEADSLGYQFYSYGDAMFIFKAHPYQF